MMRRKISLIVVYTLMLALGLSPTKGQDLIDLSQPDIISTSNVNQIELLSTIETLYTDHLAFSGDGALLATGASTSVKLWDIHTGALVDEISRPRSDDARVASLAFSPITNLLAITWTDGLSIWDMENNVHSILEQNNRLYTFQVVFSPDGSILAADCGSGISICLWDAESLQLITTLENQSQGISTGELGLPVSGLSINSTNTLLAGATGEGIFLIWDLMSYQVVAEIEAYNRDHPILDIAFTSDNRLVTSSYLGIKIWDTSDWSEIRYISETYYVWSVAPNPTATILASSGYLAQDYSAYANVVQLWDIDTGEELANLGGTQDRVNGLTFNAQGTLLAVGRFNGNIELWGVSTSP